ALPILLQEAEEKMKHAVQAARRELATIRTGRANPALLDRITVDYYGTPTPINQLASISVPEARLLVIQPWDKNALKDIEKAILKSDLGLVPPPAGNVRGLQAPQPTGEGRRELPGTAGKETEVRRGAGRNGGRAVTEPIKSRERKASCPRTRPGG